MYENVSLSVCCSLCIFTELNKILSYHLRYTLYNIIDKKSSKIDKFVVASYSHFKVIQIFKEF